MMGSKTTFILFIMIVLVNSNLWDNIFSETLATSPILMQESINFKFPIKYEGIQLEGNVDFNRQLNVLTLTVTKFLFIVPMQVFRLQIQIDNFLLTISSVLEDCSKYKLILTQTSSGKMQKFPVQSKIFLINILFKFTRRNIKNNLFNEYILMPDLIFSHEKAHEQYQINPILIVNDKGSIVKIFEDSTQNKEVPFKLKSNVKKILQCEGEIKELTKEDLYKMIKDSIQNKDYEKIPGFDSSKVPKLPDFDIQKLPINLNK